MADDIHQVTIEEIARVILLGFTIGYANRRSPQDFLNDHFPGIELYPFLEELNDLLVPHAEDTLSKSIKMNDGEPALLGIGYYSANSGDEESGLVFSRSFTKYTQQLVVDHDYFSLPLAARHQGVAKKVLACCLKQYLNMSVSKIRVHAALQDGGYVWARVGFKAIKRSQMDVILLHAKQVLNPQNFSVAERLYLGYYNSEPSGTAFPIQDWARLSFMQPILKGSDWQGEIDLTDPVELRNFNNYVAG